MTEDVPEYHYTVEPLPPNALGRRYRWQLWRGERLVAGGWHLGERRALISLRTAAVRVSHRRLGLTAIRPERAVVDGALVTGATFRISSGAVACVVAPRPVGARGGQARAA